MKTLKFPFRTLAATFTLLTFSFSGITPLQAAPPTRVVNPTAQDIDDMMKKLTDPELDYYQKKRIAAVVFVHQDVYRNAVIEGKMPKDGKNVQAFLEFKVRLQKDVAERMNMKHRNLTGENIKQPIIPFAYNNILSDDDVITGAGKGGKDLEKLYTESLDELIQERAGQPMTEFDRHRVDVNGLAWDMTQKGGLENYWHKEKYINPQSGFANQQKLIGAGDAVQVMGFDENGKVIYLQGDAKKNAIMTLTVDKPMDIPGMGTQGSGSMSDYARMAEIHQVQFKGGQVSMQEIASFIRNQKYTDRVFKDFEAIILKGNPPGQLDPDMDRFLKVSKEIRDLTTALDVAKVLEKEYGIKIVNADGSVNFGKLKDAMGMHQTKQLSQMVPKMIGAVSANEAVKISAWLKANGGKRALLRKQLALTYAPFSQERMQTILADLDKVDIPAEDKAWLKNVLTNDAEQIRKYAEIMKLSPEELVRHLGIEGDNMRAVDLMEAMDGNVRTLGAEMLRRPGGSRMQQFLKSKTAKALNLDTMLDGTREQKLMLYSMMLLAVARAYNASERNDEAIKKAGMALFEMIPFVASILRFSEMEFKEAFKELAMDIFPPLALAYIAGTFLNFAGTIAKDMFTENAWEGLVNNALRELTDDDFEKTEIKYYRLKNRESYLQYLEEVDAGFGRVVKLASLIAPEVDALMSRNPEVKTNEAAMHTLNYFEEYDPLGIQNSILRDATIEEIKQGLLVGKKFDNPSESPVRRMAAKLIAENMKVRAQMYTKVLEGFIDRIEKTYNERKKEDEDEDISSIITDAQRIIKQMYENAPEAIKKSQWASEKLTAEYRQVVEFLKDYKAGDKTAFEVRAEMQGIIDEFARFIQDLLRAVELAEEKNALNLSAHIFGGEKSTIATNAVLLGHPFRIGISAHVNPKRAGTSMTVFFYLESQVSSNLVLLGQTTVSGQGSGDGLIVIDEFSKSSQLQIPIGKLKPEFEQESLYVIHPVIAFGGWTDPMASVGYGALQDPSEYPEYFTPERVAFAGSPVNLEVRKPKISLKVPPVIYKNDRAKAKVYLDVPEYARQESASGEFVFRGPGPGEEPKMDPGMMVDPVSLDPEKPSDPKIIMGEEKSPEGTYFIQFTGKLRGLPNEAQPLPKIQSFEYTHQNNPLLGEDLTKLLEKMKSLQGESTGLLSAIKSAKDDFFKNIGEAFTAIQEFQNLSTQLETSIDTLNAKAAPLFELVTNSEEASTEASRAGVAAAEAHSTAEGHVLKVCETAKAMSGVKDPKQLGEMVSTARDANGEFMAQKTTFDKELENARLAQVNADSAYQQANTIFTEIKKEKIDLSGLSEKLEEARSAGTGSQSALALAESKLSKLGETQSAAGNLLEQGDQILRGLTDTDAKAKNGEMFKEMQGIYTIIANDLSTARGLVDSMKAKDGEWQSQMNAAEFKQSGIQQKADDFSSAMLTEADLKRAAQASENSKASYETASAYSGAAAKLSSSSGICLAEAEKIFAKHGDKKNLSDLDCSAQPGTIPRLRENGEAYCGCLEGKSWDEKRKQCVSAMQANLSDVDCSGIPGSVARWDDKNQKAYCGCVGDKVWNASQTACVAAQQQQPQQQALPTQPQVPVQQQPAVDCSMYPNTAPQWDASINQYRCNCVGGLMWNNSSQRCESPQNLANQIDCSMYPNTSGQWDPSINQFRCNCNSGYVWNSLTSKCETPFNQQSNTGLGNPGSAANVDCSAWPGTVAQWDASINNYRCNCANGVWNQASGTCASNPQQTDPLAGLFGTQPSGNSGGADPFSVLTNTPPVYQGGTGGGTGGGGTGTGTGGGTTTPPAQNPPASNNSGCPPGSINLLGVCSATGTTGSSTTTPSGSGNTSCPSGTVNIGGTCYKQTSGGPVSGNAGNTNQWNFS